MRSRTLRRALWLYAVLLVPVLWLATRFQPYMVDGDGVAYMDIADLLRTHRWAGAVNGYWNPLYPAALAVGQLIAHPSRWTELATFRAVNFAIFLLEAVAVVMFAGALEGLRQRWSSSNPGRPFLLSRQALQLLGLGLLVMSSQRELPPAAIKPDSLLLALMLLGFAALLRCLATGSLLSAALLGLFFGLAYLTKSFAFLVTLLSVAALFAFRLWSARERPLRAALAAGLALLVFALTAGPYVLALSRQKHRFDFGDSGALNYAWYAAGTRKFHVEPWMTSEFGTSTVHLTHPEAQLLASPGIYSYRAEPYGSMPNWFDPTFFHERTVPHLNLPVLLRRDARNVVMTLRFLLNHPEGIVLLALLLSLGARLGIRDLRRDVFWLPMVLLGLAMWAIYGMVNIEDRYVTLAWLVVLLPVVAALETRVDGGADAGLQKAATWQRRSAQGMVVLLAFLALGESLRIAAEERRSGPTPSWDQPDIYGAAHGLAALGIRPGDEIACMGTMACVNDIYWMRLAGVRTLTEVYNPDAAHLLPEWNGLPNRDEVLNVLRGQGARVLVARFGAGALNAPQAALPGWVQLGETGFYALPLTPTSTVPSAALSTTPAPETMPWPLHMQEAP